RMKPNTPTQNSTQDLTQQLQKALAAIHELGQELVLTRDETQIARAVVKAARQALRFQVCALSLVQGSELVTVASEGFGQSLADMRMSLDGLQGIVVAVARSGGPLYVPDVSEDSRYVVGGEFQARSELAVPLKAGERVIGVLNVESDRLDAFDAADQQQLSTLADVAAVALESARAYQAEQQRAAEVTALYQLGMALVTERDPTAIAARVFEQLDGLLLEIKTVTLSLFDLATGRLVNYAVDEGETAIPQSFALAEAGLPGRVMLSGEPLRLDDLRAAPSPGPGDAPPCAWLGLPLRVADRITGCLGVQSHRSYAFGAAEERLLAQIAAQVAPVLENARLFDETRLHLAREMRLAELAHTLGGEMKLAALIPRLLPPVVELAGADAGTVAVLEPSRQIITYPF
ncbi:MAG: GAF domain-containing protein, partial [Delftia sp.]|nr:GAF domain-containing protein [Delftia sp.]